MEEGWFRDGKGEECECEGEESSYSWGVMPAFAFPVVREDQKEWVRGIVEVMREVWVTILFGSRLVSVLALDDGDEQMEKGVVR